MDQVALEPATQSYVPADRTAIIHCVQNLIENAVKYSAPGSPVLVRTGRQGNAAFVEVIDNGIGIPAADQENIFEKFYRSENARATNAQGTGKIKNALPAWMRNRRMTCGVCSPPNSRHRMGTGPYLLPV